MPTFVDESAAEEFNCVICLDVFKEPVLIGCEDHIFCKQCITELISNKKRFNCPVCRKEVKPKSIHRVQFIDRQINKLLVKCPNYQITSEKAKHLNKEYQSLQQNENTNNSNSPILRRSARLKNIFKEQETAQKRKKRKLNDEELCQWTGAFGDLQHHIKKCELQLQKCKYCGVSMLRRELNYHYGLCGSYPLLCTQCNTKNIKRSCMAIHISWYCPMTLIECDRKCGVQIPRSKRDEHIKKDCAESMSRCGFQDVGCHQTFKRKNATNHYKTYMESHLLLIKNSKCILESRMDEFEEENERLKRKISGLEATLQSKIQQIQQAQQIQRMQQTQQITEAILRNKELSTQQIASLHARVIALESRNRSNTQNQFAWGLRHTN